MGNRATTVRRAIRRQLAALVVLVAALAGSGGRAEAVDQDEMYELWAEAGKQFDAERVFIPADAEDSRWVSRVGDRIVASWPDRRWVTHTFVVIDEATPKAWSFPVSPVHHRVYVTTGLLEFIRERVSTCADDALAGVLGHEMAHLMRDHHLLRHRQAELLGLEVPKELAQWPARVVGAWQKEDEFEADRYGAFYALHAGYRFDGITLFLARYMGRYGDDGLLDAVGDSLGRVHPSLSERIEALDKERGRIEEAERVFQIGVGMLRAGAWETAAGCFAEVRKTFAMSPSVVHNLAYAELKEYEASVSPGPPVEECVSTSYVSELRPKGPGAAAEQVVLAEAKVDFLKACDLDHAGSFAAARLGLACAYLYEGDDARAEGCLQEMTVGLDDPAYLNLAGVLAERRGDLAGAQRSYLKALGLPATGDPLGSIEVVEHSPRPYLPALYNLARVLEKQGNQPLAARLYRLYLRVEGNRSGYGIRARNGLLRCGGELTEVESPEVIDSYRGIDIRSSGELVVRAALGEPEGQLRLDAGRGSLVIYDYGSQGIEVVAASPDKTDTGQTVVQYIVLSGANEDRVAGVRVGDSYDTVRDQLGSPREVVGGPGAKAWWDYAQSGVAFSVADGKVEQCRISGRR